MRTKFFGASLVIGAIAAIVGIATVAQADHSWGGYHWARTTSPLTLKLGDDVSPVWDAYLATASSDWSASSTLLVATVVSSGKEPRRCSPTLGRVEVCNAKYGNNGWLGIASIWASGSHITQGTVKMNDTYFNTGTYNTAAWRHLVMCQEIGHTFGLDHQDEIFGNTNLGTCMDYTNDPSGVIYGQLSNEHPNAHDYEELGIIYSHFDTTTTVSSATASNGKPAFVGQDMDMSDPSAWGKAVKQDAQGKDSLFVRDFGNGEKVFTFVTWAE